MNISSINLQRKLDQFTEHWSPKIIAQMNDTQFKLAKIQGEFLWHRHPETDEAFLVLEGNMSIEFHDGTVDLKAGEMFVVPQNVEHRPFAKQECKIMLIEPAGTLNTGDKTGDMTVKNDVWI